jgi:hypothetical protein
VENWTLSLARRSFGVLSWYLFYVGTAQHAESHLHDTMLINRDRRAVSLGIDGVFVDQHLFLAIYEGKANCTSTVCNLFV